MHTIEGNIVQMELFDWQDEEPVLIWRRFAEADTYAEYLANMGYVFDATFDDRLGERWNREDYDPLTYVDVTLWGPYIKSIK